MPKYVVSSPGSLSDHYAIHTDGKYFGVEVLKSKGARTYANLGVKNGHAIEFSISENGKMLRMGFNAEYAASVASGDGKRPMDAREIKQFYTDVSGTLECFGTQVLGIGIPRWITGRPTRRRVRRDLDKVYENARFNSLPQLDID